MKMHSCHFLVKQFQMGGTVCLWYLYPYIYWYFLIFSNKLTVLNGFSLTVCKCLAVTFSSSSFKWGGTICLWHMYPYIYWYFLISSYYLTVSNGCSLTAMKMHSCHFLVKQFQMGGDHLPLVSTCFLCSGIS